MKKSSAILYSFLAAAVLLAAVVGCSKQTRKNRYLARAEKDFAAGQYDRAEIEYMSVLRVPPPAPLAVARLGQIYLASGKVPQAHAYLQKAVELQPTDLDLRLKFAQACQAIGKLKEARTNALQVLDKQPGHGDALILAVETTMGTNQLADTLRRLNAVPAADQGKPEFLLARGGLHLRSRELEQAEADFKNAVEVAPNSSQAHLALGSFYLLRTNLAAAEVELKAASGLAEPRSLAPIRYAEFKLRNKSTDEARALAQQITSKTPDFIPAWTFLARLAYSEQKADECNKLIDTILTKDRINLDALLLKGDLLLARADPTNAIVQFERIQSVYGKVPLVQYKLALAQLQNRETAKAMSSLNDALAAQPGYADAILLKANLQIRAGDSLSAITSLGKLVKDQPWLFRAHLLLAEACLAQKNTADAVVVYQRMATLFPKSPEVQLILGSVYAAQKDRDQARKAFESALEKAPDYLPAEEKLVDLDLNQKDFKSAGERAQAVITRKPAAPEGWLLSAKVRLAQAVEQTGVTNVESLLTVFRTRLAQMPAAQAHMQEAEKALLKAIELNPENSLTSIMLAQLYTRTGRQQEALERLTLLAKTNNVTALMQMGIIQSELKNYTAARDAYEKLLQVNPKASPALNNLAYLYTEHLPDMDKAYAMAQKARELLPYDPRTADTLGWVLCKRGEYERAMGLLQESASRMPIDPEVQLHLGMAHYMLGEEELARVAFERALQSTREFPGKEEGARRLGLLNMSATSDPARLAELRTMLKSQPDDPIILLRLAAQQEAAGQYAEARDSYETMLKKQPRNSRVQLKLARVYAEHLNEPGKALDLAKDAHSIAPEDAEISYFLGRLVFRNGDHRWALSLIQEAARKLPENPELSYDLGWACYSVGNIDQAQAAMKLVADAKENRRAEEAKKFLNFVAVTTDPARCQAATAEARAVLEREPNYVPGLMVVAFSQEREGNFKESAATYDKVLAAYPSFAPAMKAMAVLYAFRLGNDQQAYDLAMKARASMPQDAELGKVLGVLSYRKADYSRAAQLLTTSARTLPEDAELQFYLGMAQYRANQKTESAETLKRALSLKLDPNLAGEANKVLQELSAK